MSILIKGMEMPKTCSDCEWSYYVGNGRAMCKRVSKTDKTDIMTKRRADFCPLIELPPHGRLIDGDKFYKVMCSHWVLSLGEAYKRLEEFLEKPVIEAEDGT